MNTALKLSEAKTKQRFERREDQRFRRGGFGHTAEFAAITGNNDTRDRLAEHIRTKLQKHDTYRLRILDAYSLATAGLASLLNSILQDIQEPARSIDIGLCIQSVEWESGQSRRVRKRIGKIGNLKSRQKAARAEGYGGGDWTEAKRIKVGNLFLNWCADALPDFFEVKADEYGASFVNVRDDAQDAICRLREALSIANPFFLPSTIPPDPWAGWRRGAIGMSATHWRKVLSEPATRKRRAK